MLKVATKIGVSSIHGIGLFAAEVIEQDTVVWVFDSLLDKRYVLDEIVQLCPRTELLNYFYRNKETGLFVLCGDDARFMNHSSTPNLIGIADNEEGTNIAARRIEVGEELTCNYAEFDSLVNIEEFEESPVAA